MRFVRSPFPLTLAASVLLHAGVFAWFALGDAPPRSLGMERGTYSIALVSSVAAVEELPDLIVEELPPIPPLAAAEVVEPPLEDIIVPLPEQMHPRDFLTLVTEQLSRPIPIVMPLPAIVYPEKLVTPSQLPDPPKEPVRVAPPEPMAEKPSEKPREKVAEKPPEKKPEKPAETSSKPSVASVGSAASSGAAVDELPSTFYNPTPPYPALALASGLEGLVTIWAKVGADGLVESAVVHASSGVPSLDESALNTVKRWQFHPAKRRGTPVAQEVEVPIRFVIRYR